MRFQGDLLDPVSAVNMPADLILVLSATDFFGQKIAVISINFQHSERRKPFPVEDDHGIHQDTDQNRLHQKHEQVKAEKGRKITELSGDCHGDENLQKINGEERHRLCRHHIGDTIDSDLEGARSSSDDQIEDGINTRRHGEVSLSKERTGIIMSRHKGIPVQEEKKRCKKNQDRRTAPAIYILGFDLCCPDHPVLCHLRKRLFPLCHSLPPLRRFCF